MAFRQASAHGLNLARTWAFRDGGDQPLQSSLGVYDEAMFQGLDFVIAEARRHGIYLLLCITNNFDNLGSKQQYVRWAADTGHNLTTANDFFTSSVLKSYYNKNHVKAVLTRVNTLTGVAYKDDPTIFAWELMNKSRCEADSTGAMVQAWVEEMTPYMKRVGGGRHLVTAGLEVFYGDGEHESKELNPWGIYPSTRARSSTRSRSALSAWMRTRRISIWQRRREGSVEGAACVRAFVAPLPMSAAVYLPSDLGSRGGGRRVWRGVVDCGVAGPAWRERQRGRERKGKRKTGMTDTWGR